MKTLIVVDIQKCCVIDEHYWKTDFETLERLYSKYSKTDLRGSTLNYHLNGYVFWKHLKG